MRAESLEIYDFIKAKRTTTKMIQKSHRESETVDGIL